MDKKLIFEEGYNKYYRATLSRDINSSNNVNFDELLKFIGTHKPYKNREPIGSAYMAIRKKTNELLGLTWKDFKVRTSKKEVAALRNYYKNGSQLYVKIPFKIAYIFKAVIQIVEELRNEGFGIPPRLMPLINQTYLLAFYKENVDAYDASKHDIPKDKEAQLALNSDFHNNLSPLNSIFE